MGTDFKCQLCGGTFTKGRPDGEAMAEAREEFGDVPMEVICDDCYKRVFTPADALSWSEVQAIEMRARWTEEEMNDPNSIPVSKWPACIVEGCPHRCSLRLLSKLCDPHTKRARASGEV